MDTSGIQKLKFNKSALFILQLPNGDSFNYKITRKLEFITSQGELQFYQLNQFEHKR